MPWHIYNATIFPGLLLSRYDGPLGIITAIAAIKMAVVSNLGLWPEVHAPVDVNDEIVVSAEASGSLERTVHIVAFADEEGVRFQSTFLGSRALVRTKIIFVKTFPGALTLIRTSTLCDNT